MQLKSLVVALTLAATATPTFGATFASKAVKVFNGPAFSKAIKSSSKATLAVYFAPWCGHCKNLGPEFDKAAENLKGLANLVAIDCDAEINKQHCGEIGVRGFPTLKFFPGGSAPAEDYNGERQASPIVKFITSRMPSFVKPVSSPSALSSLRTTPQKEGKPISLLFTSAKTVTPLYKALSSEFRKGIEFYAAREEKVKEALGEWGVDKVPQLVVLDGGEVVKYDGPLKFDDIKKFLEPFKVKGEAAIKKAAQKKEQAKDEL